MTGSLSPGQRARYERDGVLYPIRVLTETQAADAMARFAALEARDGGKLRPDTRGKPHILLPWLNELVRRKEILDAVEGLVGPNLLCWSSSFFAKSPGDGAYISWHQDSTYWRLSGIDVVTAWVAFTPSTPENGCLQVIPGTHLAEQLPHRDSFSRENLLSRGQEIAVKVNQSKAVNVVLGPGEMSLHHIRIAHGSEPNKGTARRVGFAIRYIPTHIRQLSVRTTALLVRGVDDYGHFDPEPIPSTEFEPAAVAFHAHAISRLLEAGRAETANAPTNA